MDKEKSITITEPSNENLFNFAARISQSIHDGSIRPEGYPESGEKDVSEDLEEILVEKISSD
ncbi:MAG: hypothetical protein ABJN98_01940 [Roseibium sp.]